VTDFSIVLFTTCHEHRAYPTIEFYWPFRLSSKKLQRAGNQVSGKDQHNYQTAVRAAHKKVHSFHVLVQSQTSSNSISKKAW